MALPSPIHSSSKRRRPARSAVATSIRRRWARRLPRPSTPSRPERSTKAGRMRTLLAALLLLPTVALAQTGGGYDLTRNVIAGGGATFSTGGAYTVGGTIGQPAAGAPLGGAFAVRGGFWASALSGATSCFGDCNDSGTLTASDL